jgi:hypothetical protein
VFLSKPLSNVSVMNEFKVTINYFMFAARYIVIICECEVVLEYITKIDGGSLDPKSHNLIDLSSD